MNMAIITDSLKVSFLLMTMSIFSCLFTQAQDTLAIHDFDSLVHTYYDKMKNVHETNDTLSVTDVINIIKVDNTIMKNQQSNKKREEFFLTFARYFHINFVAYAIKIIEGKVTYGFGWYSAKYNICLGGHLVHPESYYFLRN